MQETWKSRCIALAVAFAAGCGGGTSPGPASDPDAAVDAQDIASHEPDLESAPADEGAVEFGDEAGAETQQPKPCSSHGDCPGGWCGPTADGNACTSLCGKNEDCKEGQECVVVSGAVPEQVWACIDQSAGTCLPCTTDSDCAVALWKDGGKCVLLDGRRFCLKSCDGSGCPTGSTCMDGAVERGMAKVCIPDSGKCECTTLGEGKNGACLIWNEFGTCPGEYACQDGKAGQCGGKPAVAEECNGKDDDCDGQADEDLPAMPCDLSNEFGTCKGTIACKEGKETCEGQYAAQEICNIEDDDCDGQTDEGFPPPKPGCEPCSPCDKDGDGVIDPEDNCPDSPNADQTDFDKDGAGDACDDDDDGDGAPDQADNCLLLPNPDQADLDEDGKGDACDLDRDGDGIANVNDNCADAPNPGQEDLDLDGTGDACDLDADGDGILDAGDNCPGVPNPDQKDLDLDGLGDACDLDGDGDGVVGPEDNCPDVANPAQSDTDADGIGDVCDADIDGDGLLNPADNCPDVANPDQKDMDKDGQGDACDNDWDGDGVKNEWDNCPLVANSIQSDADKDGVGDACDDDKDGDGVPNATDNCPGVPNPYQEDENKNGIGDACEGDWDGDGVTNKADNCPWDANPDQADKDKDGKGDACDCDLDGDGAANANPGCDECDPCDNCPLDGNPGQEDLDGDGTGDACDKDKDGDGDPDAEDCSPLDAAVFHGQTEACNGKDDDCDGVTDEEDATGCTGLYMDEDGDGYGTGAPRCLCAAQGLYKATVTGDCNDKDAAVNQGKTEVCWNNKDDDCSGSQNDQGAAGCTKFWVDADGDGHGAGDPACLCFPEGKATAKAADDCDDADPTASPDLPEKCNDGKDNNCNGQIDEPSCQGCTIFFKDADQDLFGVDSDKKCLGVPVAPYTATKVGDCDDTDAAVFPGADEVCNGIDDNCDGVIDPAASGGCTAFYPDLDKDGFGANAAGKCYCKPTGTYTATDAGDCNDNDAGINPSKEESCNGKDDDCDGLTDEEGASGCKPWYLDEDQDGYGVTGDFKCMCAGAGKHTAQAGGDCDDADMAIHPGAKESCGNAKDDDCNGHVDEEGAMGCVLLFADVDGDGFGDASDKKCLCASGGTYTATKSGDCDDSDAAMYPGAPEKCDGKDNDCNGLKDEEGSSGCTQFYFDGDGDSYGLTALSKCLCAATGKYTATSGGDCDDVDKTVSPGAKEVCANGKDDDCDGVQNEEDSVGCATFFLDGDGDGYGLDSDSKCLCAASGKYKAVQGGDCDDADGAIRPGATEACNGKDDDCDGQKDEEGATGCATWYLDNDGDGFGDSTAKKCLCAASGKYSTTKGGDCDDNLASVYPGAAEVCANGKDDNCDGIVDYGLGCLAKSCKGIKEMGLTAPSGVYKIDPDGTAGAIQPFDVYCDMVADGGGWTLVIKVDGNSSNFVYHSSYWENDQTYNETSPGLNTTEAKLRSFSTVPFTAIRFGMSTGGGATNWITLSKTANSLLDVMKTGYQATSMGRAAWKAMVPNSSLQPHCNLEGFNTTHSCMWDLSASGVARVRIGIIANQENDCCSPDSRIGIGGGGTYCGQSGTNACGNEATCSADNGDVHITSFGWVLVR